MGKSSSWSCKNANANPSAQVVSCLDESFIGQVCNKLNVELCFGKGPMSNSTPYFILGTISILAILPLFLHKRAAWPLILLFSFSGMIYVFEFYIFVLHNSYRYFPHIVDISYYDNVIGAVVSNLLTVPVAATYISVYKLNWKWIVSFAFIYGGIESLFLRLDVYEHHWWKTPYTIIALLIFFRFAREWLVWLSGRNRAIRFVALDMFTYSVVATIVFTLALSGIRIFKFGHFDDPYRDDIFFSAIYSFFKAFVLTVGVTASHRLWSRAASLLVIFVAQLVLMRLGIINVMIPLWQYWLIYAPCCCIVLWLVVISYRKLNGFNLKT